MQNWKRQIPTIMTSQELLDRAFARASKAEVNGAVPFDTVKKTNIAKITAIGDMTVTTLLKYARAFPKLEKTDDFFSQLVDVIIGQDKLKKALANVTWCAEKCSDLQRAYLSRVRKAPTIDAVAKATREFYGRFSSVINRVEPELLFLQKARDQLRELPSIDANVQTIVIAGYPNVGKSQLMDRVSSAKPAIAPYPFTTKGIVVGHIKSGWRTFQIIDTPGLLDRELEERNAIELQAVLALRYLADIIIFILDPSETCGYTMERQLSLLDSIRRNFPDIPFIEVENKADLEGTSTGRMRISALTGEGVDDLMAKAQEMLKAMRLTDMDKLPVK
jgi:nucleolar GTP-binding protein